jgi:uncharacterized protein (DUF1330 family)
MAGYVVVNLDVTDPEMFNRYREAVIPLVAAKGGRYLVVDFDRKDLDGQSRAGLAVLEFDSVQAAEDFYYSAEYQGISGLRLGSTEGWIRVAPTLPAA